MLICGNGSQVLGKCKIFYQPKLILLRIRSCNGSLKRTGRKNMQQAVWCLQVPNSVLALQACCPYRRSACANTQDELNIAVVNCCATGVALILTEILKELNLSIRHFSICLDCYYATTFNCFSYQQIQFYLKAKPLFLVKM